MLMNSQVAEKTLESVIFAAKKSTDHIQDVIEAVAAPLYVTDPDGFVTHFNKACIGFSGRIPAVGKDRWCVTWKLYSNNGEFLPHNQCPMAFAIKERKTVRGLTAVAERPDGTRVNFQPFPTPVLDSEGNLIVAINMLIDVTDVRQIAELRSQAERCERMAASTNDTRSAHILAAMAIEYRGKASKLSEKQP
jgi:PAS domain-containing protein